MKPYIILLLTFLLGATGVLAGSITELDGITAENLFIDVPERDAISFSYKEASHRVHVSEVRDTKVDLTLFIDRERVYGERNPTYLTLKPNDLAKVDIDKDHINDILIGVANIDSVKKVVTLVIREAVTDEERGLNPVEEFSSSSIEENNNDGTGATVFNPNGSIIKIANLITVLLVIVVVVLGYLLIRRRR